MSDSEGDTKTVLTCPKYRGEYLQWRRQFILYASVKGFKEAVSKTADPNLPEVEYLLTVGDQAKAKREKLSMKKNCLALNQLYAAFTKHKTILRMIQITCTDDWPSGQAWQVMAKLNKKFCPNDSIASLQAEIELAAIKMKKNEDPTEFHDKLYEVKQRYPTAISDLQVRNAMIRQCRKEYTEEIVKAMSTPDSTTDDLLDGMLNRFRCLTAHADASDSEEEDVALVTYQRNPYRQPSRNYQREITCYLCGEKGHKIVDCPKRAGGQRAKCEYCGRVGHTIKKCYHHPDNLPTAPDWVKRMHGMKVEEEMNTIPKEEVGAFSFMAPESDENEVSFALFERGETDVETSTMIVETLSDGGDLPSDESDDPESKMEDVSSESPSITSSEEDSTYYDPMEDDDLDSCFDIP